MAELIREIKEGKVRLLKEAAADRPLWDRLVAPFAGRSWLDVPWYFAEAYFYRRLLEATGYFQPGPWQGFDPYGAVKGTEWQPEAAPRRPACSARSAARGARAALCRAAAGEPVGKSVDLSYRVAEQDGRHEPREGGIGF